MLTSNLNLIYTTLSPDFNVRLISFNPLPLPQLCTSRVIKMSNPGHDQSGTEVQFVILVFDSAKVLCWMPFLTQPSAFLPRLRTWTWKHSDILSRRKKTVGFISSFSNNREFEGGRGSGCGNYRGNIHLEKICEHLRVINLKVWSCFKAEWKKILNSLSFCTFFLSFIQNALPFARAHLLIRTCSESVSTT